MKVYVQQEQQEKPSRQSVVEWVGTPGLKSRQPTSKLKATKMAVTACWESNNDRKMKMNSHGLVVNCLVLLEQNSDWWVQTQR